MSYIRELCAIGGASGGEWRVAEYIENKIKTFCSDIERDKMGNVIAKMSFGDVSYANRRRIMVSAHMDEVGFMINELRDDGTLGFDTVGGISEGVIAGRHVSVMTRSGELCGVIASRAIHHKKKEEREKCVPLEELYIDIGLTDRESAERHVRIGDLAVFNSETYEFGGGYIKAKALDDRMGCSAMMEIIERFSKNPPRTDADVYFCFTVREEIGLSGARTAAYRIRPHIGIVLETTAVADICDVPSHKRVATLGGGVCVSFMDRSTVYDRELFELAMRTAEKSGISAQVKQYVSGGNDASGIHKTAEGVRVMALSVPTRYLHSPACVAKLSDYEAQRDLCAEVLAAL